MENIMNYIRHRQSGIGSLLGFNTNYFNWPNRMQLFGKDFSNKVKYDIFYGRNDIENIP